MAPLSSTLDCRVWRRTLAWQPSTTPGGWSGCTGTVARTPGPSYVPWVGTPTTLLPLNLLLQPTFLLHPVLPLPSLLLPLHLILHPTFLLHPIHPLSTSPACSSLLPPPQLAPPPPWTCAPPAPCPSWGTPGGPTLSSGASSPPPTPRCRAAPPHSWLQSQCSGRSAPVRGLQS